MAHICIVTASHLCRNPRVVKEASALSEHGHDVTVLRPLFSEELTMLDEEISGGQKWKVRVSVDLRAKKLNSLKRAYLRASRKLGAELIRYFGVESGWAVGYGPFHTLEVTRREKADLFIGHQELGAWIVCRLMKEGKRVGADLEDWYSKDLLPEAQATRPLKLLRKCEYLLLKHAAHVTTTSKSMASALAKTYRTAEPTTIYNAFPWTDREGLGSDTKDRSGCELPSLQWTSQTIGPGRGLNILCDALKMVERPVAVHLRGSHTASVETWLRGIFPFAQGHNLYIHDMVPPCELLSRIAEHDIGLALESNQPASRDLTVTNKMLHNLLGGNAVVATNTEGQSEIARLAPSAVRLCRNNDAADLALELNYLLVDQRRLKEAKAAALVAARDHFCWERQAAVLLDSIERALCLN